jgi:hypothetical protein
MHKYAKYVTIKKIVARIVGASRQKFSCKVCEYCAENLGGAKKGCVRINLSVLCVIILNYGGNFHCGKNAHSQASFLVSTLFIKEILAN